MHKHLIFITYIASLFLSSCSVYRIDIQQGNIVTQDMIDLLRPNMNKTKVKYIMGTPLLIDVFHQNRWDYIYLVQSGSEDRIQKRISLFFENDTLAGVQGDFRPSNLPVVDAPKKSTVLVPKRNLDKTLLQKVKSLLFLDAID